jgi:group I intron endonuclease
MSSSIPQTSGIYKITCLPTGKIYIGSASSLYHRWSNHRTYLRANAHVNRFLQHAWNKYGPDAFCFEVLELVLSPFLVEREQFYLDKLRPYDHERGFNIERLAHAQFTGKRKTKRVHSPETRAKIGAANSRPWSPETRARRQGMLLKRNLSEEQRRRLAANHSKTYVVSSPEEQEFLVTNLTAFCRQHGLSPSCMFDVAAGRRIAHRGWRCSPFQEKE